MGTQKSDNAAYTLRANAIALRDIAHYDRNVIYAGMLYTIASIQFALKYLRVGR